MSRSEKKTPIIKYGGYGKFGKHLANKRVRRFDIGNYGSYKKLYKTYDIYNIKDSLYKTDVGIDGIPKPYYSDRLMAINEIMDYWRK